MLFRLLGFLPLCLCWGWLRCRLRTSHRSLGHRRTNPSYLKNAIWRILVDFWNQRFISRDNLNVKYINLQGRIQDFSEGDANPTPFFPKTARKWRKLDRGRGHTSKLLLWSATDLLKYYFSLLIFLLEHTRLHFTIESKEWSYCLHWGFSLNTFDRILGRLTPSGRL